MNLTYYTLDAEHHPIPVDDIIEWAKWFETANRSVALTHFDPDIVVSTVFLGLDHRFFADGPPMLFETMVFGISMQDGNMQWRYSSWDDAETGHKATVRKVKDLIAKAAQLKIPERPT